MTVLTTTSKQAAQVMDGIVTNFAFTFRALTTEPDGIKVTLLQTVTEIETDLTYTAGAPGATEYSVAVDADGIGGSITVGDAQDSNYTITIYRVYDIDQTSNYADFNSFPADTVETNYDKAIMVSQQLDEINDRSITLPVTVGGGVSTELPLPSADDLIGWNATATALVNIDLAAIPANNKVGVDSGATGDFLGTLGTDGALRVSGLLTYVDGGDFVTIGLTDGLIDHDALANFTTTEHFTMLDEDDLSSDSDTQAATQQSIKAYVDAATSASLTQAITQASHPFSLGDWVYHNGTIYALADASAAGTAEAIGVVLSDDGTNDFTIQFGGRITGLSGLTAGEAHFLSETPGAITATAPTTESAVQKPVLIADSTTTGYVFNMRGSTITNNELSFYTSFVDADLAAGVLTVAHNLGHKFAQVTVYDNTDKMIIPDEITLTDNNNLAVDLGSFGTITGTWNVVVLDKGATVSANNISFAVVNNANQLNITKDIEVEVDFQTELFDVGSNFASNTFTAPITGKYQLNATVQYESIDVTATNYRMSIITTAVTQVVYDIITNDTARAFTTSGVFAMTAGDTATVSVRQNGGTGGTVDLANGSARFSGHYVTN